MDEMLPNVIGNISQHNYHLLITLGLSMNSSLGLIIEAYFQALGCDFNQRNLLTYIKIDCRLFFKSFGE
jgi:hypothetical protein